MIPTLNSPILVVFVLIDWAPSTPHSFQSEEATSIVAAAGWVDHNASPAGDDPASIVIVHVLALPTNPAFICHVPLTVPVLWPAILTSIPADIPPVITVSLVTPVFHWIITVFVLL